MNAVVRSLAKAMPSLAKNSNRYQSMAFRLAQSNLIKQAFWSNRNCCSFMGNTRVAFGYGDSLQLPKYPYKPKMPVHEFLDAHRLQYKQEASVFKIKYCPFCPKPHNNDRTNLHVLNVHKQYGYYHCFRCSAKGNWLQFREKVMQIDSDFSGRSFYSGNKTEHSHTTNPNDKISEAQYFIYKQNLRKPEFASVFEYVRSRKFNDQTIQAYNLGAGSQTFQEEDGYSQNVKLVYFPLYEIKKNSVTKNDINGKPSNFIMNNNWTQIAKVKMRGASKETKKFMRQYPIGGRRGIFGFNLIKDSDEKVVVTEGEFDAMAVFQKTKMPAVSLPQGASNLPDNLLPYFDRFEKIILWMDNDEAGRLNTVRIAEKLGLKRTYVVKHQNPKFKDANDLLIHDPQLINELIDKAKTIPDSNLVNFSLLKQSVKFKMINLESQRGLKVDWLPFFNQKVKGIRKGELTVMSGPTGSGKTTFLSQVFLDLCRRNIGVLWGSFQIKNQVLMTHMLYQFSGINLAKNIEKFDYYADKFEKLPLHLMNFHGSTNIDKILSTIVFAIEKYNIHAIVLDTLQFMISQQAEGFKKFDLQDSLMARLRDISIKFDVHVAIVIHPRKTEDNEDIGIHSIYGTSKATQQADNIWLIQNRDGFKIFDVKKNRYDGEVGKIPLGFNRQNKQFFQLKRHEFEALRTKEKSMRQIIKQRAEEQAQKNPISQEEIHMFEDEIKENELRREYRNSENSFSRRRDQ